MARRTFFFLVFPQLTGLDEGRRRIDDQVEQLKLLEYLVVVDGSIEVGQVWLTRDRFQTVGEGANIRGVVILLDMFAAAGDGDSIE